MGQYRFIYSSILLLTLFITTGTLQAQQKPELRAVWVASVVNIDWPSAGTYAPELQRESFIRLLDMHKANGMNAMVVQIRPSGDALYPSPLEPWSQWLTGAQGKPPVSYYDPLAFMIAETHKRNMEFHAWINPYRAEFRLGESSISPLHITRLHPEWFVTYGTSRLFDPGNKQVQQYITYVIKDVVERYAVDAIHFDDYFYPYPIAGQQFPDDASFSRYGNGLSRDDWRRSNVDSVIKNLNATIKNVNPKCQFGISPFGVWRNADKDPDGSKTRGSLANYDDLYANILLWLKNGWIDYVAPQLYWEFEHKVAPYQTLIDWWDKHTYGRNCYIGLGIYRAGSNANWKDKTQLPRQIEALRSKSNIQGMIFFSSNSFDKNPNGWNDSLRLHYFKDAVPTPSMPWLNK